MPQLILLIPLYIWIFLSSFPFYKFHIFTRPFVSPDASISSEWLNQSRETGWSWNKATPSAWNFRPVWQVQSIVLQIQMRPSKPPRAKYSSPQDKAIEFILASYWYFTTFSTVLMIVYCSCSTIFCLPSNKLSLMLGLMSPSVAWNLMAWVSSFMSLLGSTSSWTQSRHCLMISFLRCSVTIFLWSAF